MKNVAPPSTIKVEDERFSFCPPPLAEADKGKTFDATISVSDIPMEVQTCNSLLTKMADVVDNNDFAPDAIANASLFAPQAPQLFEEPAPELYTPTMPQAQPFQFQNQSQSLSFAEELAQVYAAHMPRVFAEQEAQRQTSPNYTGPIQSFITNEQPQEEEVITVVDFTQMASPVVAQSQSQAHVQAQAKPAKQTHSGLNALLNNRIVAKAPVNQDVSNSWFA